MAVWRRLLGVLPLFALAALALAFSLFMLRRTGVLSESLTVHDPAILNGETLEEGRSLELVTLLPKDGIPAIFNPDFIAANEAATQFAPDDLVLGVVVNGDARAYGIAHLSSHEIVNDVVGGRPIAVTW